MRPGIRAVLTAGCSCVLLKGSGGCHLPRAGSGMQGLLGRESTSPLMSCLCCPVSVLPGLGGCYTHVI